MLFPTDTIWSVEPTRFAAWAQSRVQQAEMQPRSALASVPYTVRGGILEVRLVGIMSRDDPLGEGTATAPLAEALRRAADDDAVRAVWMRIDSPGGSVDGLAELTDAAWAVRERKPLVAEIAGIAASAAYQVASQASRIVAGRMDLVGGIGTQMLIYDTSRMLDQMGIRPVVVETGEFKTAGAPGTRVTPSHESYFRAIVQAYFDDFRAAVMRGRGMSEERFAAVATGRVWPAREALALGLIDEIVAGAEPIEDVVASIARPGVPDVAAARDATEVWAMPDTTGSSPQAQQTRTAAATLAELRSLPGASAEFCLEALEQGMTLEAAARALLAASAQRIAELEAKAQAVAPLATERPAERRSAMSLARERARERGVPLITAMRELAAEKPEIVEDLLNGV